MRIDFNIDHVQIDRLGHTQRAMEGVGFIGEYLRRHVPSEDRLR